MVETPEDLEIKSEDFNFENFARDYLTDNEVRLLKPHRETIIILVNNSDKPRNFSVMAHALVWKGFVGDPDKFSKGMMFLYTICNRKLNNSGILTIRKQNEM